MTYAAMMVGVDRSRDSAARTRLAVELAVKFSAMLIGVAGESEPAPYATQDELQNIEAYLHEAESDFRKLAAGVRNLEWRAGIEFPGEILIREARLADLLIVGKTSLHGAADTGAVLLRAGRPAVVVPPNVDHLSGQRVIVAWKDTREARRTVRDAIPFLQQASEVILAGLCENEATSAKSAMKNQLNDVKKYLLCHRIIIADHVCRDAKGAVGKELLQVARDEGADLIVAGAYGHSRLGEWVFGGVTRDLLADSSVCCLFSH